MNINEYIRLRTPLALKNLLVSIIRFVPVPKIILYPVPVTQYKNTQPKPSNLFCFYEYAFMYFKVELKYVLEKYVLAPAIISFTFYFVEQSFTVASHFYVKLATVVITIKNKYVGFCILTCINI